MTMERVEIISKLFQHYGKESDPDSGYRIASYVECLSALPVGLLEVACKKAILTCNWLPSVANIVNCAHELAQASNTTDKTYSWEQAWSEIQTKMYRTPWGQTPEWSSKEIATAVNSFGWETLQRTLEKDMPIVRAQIRNIYESACKRIADEKINGFLLKNTELLLNGGGNASGNAPQALVNGSRTSENQK